jgi:hypothetical protein
MSFDITGVASTLAAVAIAAATVSTAFISINTQRAANRLARQQATIASAARMATEEVKNTLATANDTTNSKLDTIHTLVNSNMTAALQSELDATRRELVWMQSVSEPTEEAKEAMAVTESRIAELQTQLNERATAQAATQAPTTTGITTTTVTTTK